MASDVRTAGTGARVYRTLARERPGWMAALRVTLAGHLNLSGSMARSIGGTQNRAVIVGTLLLVAAGIGAAEVGFFFLARGLHIGMVIAGQPLTLPIMAVMTTQLLVLVFGVGFAISNLFYSTDVPRFMAMPLEPAAILGVRLATLYLDVLLVTVVATLPLFLAGASVLPVDVAQGVTDPDRLAALFEAPVRLTADPWYWGGVLWAWLWAPVLPLAVAALLAVVVGRAGAVGRRRDLLYIGASLLGLALAIGFQYVNFRLMPQIPSSPDQLTRLLQAPNAVILAVARFDPIARWIAAALMGGAGGAAVTSGERLVWLVLAAGTSGLLTVPVFVLAQRWYFTGVQAGLETAPARRQGHRGRLASRQVAMARLGGPARSRVAALALREWRLLLRTPPFMLPVVTNVVIPPVIVGMLLVMAPPTAGQDLQRLLSGLDPWWVAAALAAVILFMGGTTQVAPTSISREGKGLAQVAALPAGPAEQVGGRLMAAAPFSLATALMMTAVAGWIIHLPAVALTAGLGLGVVGLWPVVAGGLWIDLLWPATGWENPQQAMKGNINGLWSMVLTVLVVAVAGGAGYLVARLLGDLRWALGGAACVLLILGAVLTRLCLRQATVLLGDAGERV